MKKYYCKHCYERIKSIELDVWVLVTGTIYVSSSKCARSDDGLHEPR